MRAKPAGFLLLGLALALGWQWARSGSGHAPAPVHAELGHAEPEHAEPGHAEADGSVARADPLAPQLPRENVSARRETELVVLPTRSAPAIPDESEPFRTEAQSRAESVAATEAAVVPAASALPAPEDIEFLSDAQLGLTGSEAHAVEAGLAGQSEPPQPLRVDRGPGNEPLWIPREERLDFNVHLNLGLLGEPKVGTVTLSAVVAPFRESSLLRRPSSSSNDGLELGKLTAVARGSYAVYTLEEVISSSYLPQEFPSLLLTTTQRGSENRRRELQLGFRDGAYVAQYRSDHHCKSCTAREHFIEPAWVWQDERHCPGCKRGEHRIWRAPRERAAPQGALDMLGAVYFARSRIQAGETEVRFPLIDKLELWDVRVRPGKQKIQSVDGGRFDAMELLLETRVPEGDTSRSAKDFSGLFGIKGTISIWFHRQTGVPVLIRGEMPAGVMDLDVRVELVRWKGTPEGFGRL